MMIGYRDNEMLITKEALIPYILTGMLHAGKGIRTGWYMGCIRSAECHHAAHQRPNQSRGRDMNPAAEICSNVTGRNGKPGRLREYGIRVEEAADYAKLSAALLRQWEKEKIALYRGEQEKRPEGVHSNRFSGPPFLHFINISYQTLLTGGFGYRDPPVPSLYGRRAGDPERKSRIMQNFLLQR